MELTWKSGPGKVKLGRLYSSKITKSKQAIASILAIGDYSLLLRTYFGVDDPPPPVHEFQGIGQSRGSKGTGYRIRKVLPTLIFSTFFSFLIPPKMATSSDMHSICLSTFSM